MIRTSIKSIFVCALALLVSCAETDRPLNRLEEHLRGIRDGEVILGSVHPNVGSLLRPYGDDQYYISCTGTLIAPRVVLTAAHCMPGDDVRIFTLDADIVNGEPDSHAEVAEVVIHPDYDVGTLVFEDGNVAHHYADVAVLFLDRPLPFVNNTQLMRINLLETGMPLVGVGYGQSLDSGSNQIDGKKRQGTFSFDYMLHFLDSSRPAPDSMIYSTYHGDSTAVTCNGDSGGPIFVTINGEKLLAGVLTGGIYGTDCSEYSDNTHTAVFSHLAFIEDTLAEFTSDAEDQAEQAYELNALYLLRLDQSYYLNYLGFGEKWMAGSVDGNSEWFFIVPNGDLYLWDGTNGSGDVVPGERIAQLNVGYYEDPTLLHEAQDPNQTTVSFGNLAQTLNDRYSLDFMDSYYENWGGNGERWLIGSVVGNVRWFFILPNGDFYLWNGSGMNGDLIASSELLGQLGPSYFQDPELLYDGSHSSSNASSDPLVVLDIQYDLFSSGDYYVGYYGLEEKWIEGYTGGLSVWFFLLPDGRLFRWDGTEGQNIVSTSLYITTLSTSIYSNPSLLHDAAGD